MSKIHFPENSLLVTIKVIDLPDEKNVLWFKKYLRDVAFVTNHEETARSGQKKVISY